MLGMYTARTELGRRLLRIRERSTRSRLNVDEILALRKTRLIGEESNLWDEPNDETQSAIEESRAGEGRKVNLDEFKEMLDLPEDTESQ